VNRLTYEPDNDLRDLLRDRRGWAVQLLEHVGDLDAPDRVLLRSVYEHGMSASELAAVAGRQPRTLRHRLRQLVKRITSAEFQYVIHYRRGWPAERRAIVERLILRGHSQRRVAADLGISIHRVRQEWDRLRHELDAARNLLADRACVEQARLAR
jgi:DNA-directed RNA polymerase specialized sigma24 family protein